MAAAEVPTAMAHVCETAEEVEAALDAFGPPYVVKDDALAAGKGVVVTDDRQAAIDHAAACDRVVIEEFLDGPEVSLFAITDGETVLPLQPAQDFKRALDGDEGPNTGGMGAYTPLAWAPDDLVAEVLPPRARADGAGDGPPRHAVPGAALRRPRPDEPRRPRHRVQRPLRRPRDPVDPGAAATPRCRRCCTAPPPARSPRSACRSGSTASSVTVVVAAEGYPESPRQGRRRSTGSTRADALEGVDVIHAGTALVDGQLVTAGGRVLSVTAIGADLAEARRRAYAGVDLISIRGAHHRTDIALAAAAMGQ